LNTHARLQIFRVCWKNPNPPHGQKSRASSGSVCRHQVAEDSGARGGYLSSLHAQLAGEDYAECAAWENDKDRMTFKPRGSAMRNMLRGEYKKGVMVTNQYGGYHTPTGYPCVCIMRHDDRAKWCISRNIICCSFARISFIRVMLLTSKKLLSGLWVIVYMSMYYVLSWDLSFTQQKAP